MIGFRSGDPIAVIKGGPNDGKMIKLSDNHSDTPSNEIILDEGELKVLPSTKVIERLYITGPSGSGKSTFIGQWLSQSRKIWKGKRKKDILIFSRVEDDKPLDKFNPTRIQINDELIDDPVQAEDLEDSISIFDDVDTIADTALRKTILKLRDDVLECGRHFDIRMLCTSHLMMSGNATKTMLNESTSIVFFPRGGNTYQIKRFLKEYCGFEKDLIQKIMTLPSRWVCVRKLYPICIMYEKGAFLAVSN